MIDLLRSELPSRIEWEGGSAEVVTGFRTWLAFERVLRTTEGRKLWTGIFPHGAPAGTEWQVPALEFLESANELPRPIGNHGHTLDYLVDGELIVAAFQQAYGIDLTSCEMHWHRFKALLGGLPDDTKLAQVMGYRSWTPSASKRKHDEVMAEAKAAWALEEMDDGMGGFSSLFQSLR